MRSMTLMICALSVLLGSATADGKKGDGKKPAPQPSAESEMVAMEKARRAAMTTLGDLMRGNWNEAQTYPQSPYVPKKFSCKGTTTVQRGFGGVLLKVNHTSHVPERQYQALGIWTFDPVKKHYTLNWFDNSGHPSVFQGKLKGKKLTMVSRGGEMAMTLTYDFSGKGKDRFAWSMTMGPAGKQVPFMQCVATRRVKASKAPVKPVDPRKAGPSLPPKKGNGSDKK